MKSILALVFVLVMSGCSTKPDDRNSSPQIVRNATSSLSIALAYLQLGNTVKAEPNLQKALDENPASGAVYLGYALYYQQLGDYEKAEAAFFQAKQYSPESLIPQDFVTYLCRQGEYESATSHYTSVVSVAGDRVKKSLLIDLADCYYQQGDWIKAEKSYLQSLTQSGGTNDKALLKLAELALDRGESRTALDYLARFNDIKEHVTPESLLLEIRTYETLALTSKAQQASEMLSTLFPNHKYEGQVASLSKPKESGLEPEVDPEPVPQPVKEEVVVTNNVDEGEKIEKPPSEERVKYHVIEKGETLYRVTRIYGVSLEQLQAWNPELRANDISIGTKIYLEGK